MKSYINVHAPHTRMAYVRNYVVNKSFAKKYKEFKRDETKLNFPKAISDPNEYFANEKEFMAFIILNQRILKMLGLARIKHCNGLFPDIIAQVIGKAPRHLRIEVEVDAANYKQHNHPYNGCDLVVSWTRPSDLFVVRGVPVWSFYAYSKDSGNWEYCLAEDIHFCDTRAREKPENEKSYED